MRNAPSPSVMTERVFSIRTSLDASTVTPGSTAPDVSFTTPAIALWARATAGAASRAVASATSSTPLLRVINASITASFQSCVRVPSLRDLDSPNPAVQRTVHLWNGKRTCGANEKLMRYEDPVNDQNQVCDVCPHSRSSALDVELSDTQ